MVADCAYAGRALRGLPAAVTWTTRLRANAALYQLAPPRTGRRGRPRLKGRQLPALADLAAAAAFTATAVHRYGATATVHAAALRCLWYGVFGPQQVQVVLVRDKADATGYAIALISTDLTVNPAQLIERHAGASRSPSKTPNRPPASGRPATGYPARSNAPCRSPSS